MTEHDSPDLFEAPGPDPAADVVGLHPDGPAVDGTAVDGTVGDGITLSGIAGPLLAVGSVAALVGVVLMLLMDAGSVPFVAHPGLILVISAAIIFLVAAMLRVARVDIAEAITTVGVALMVIFGLVLMMIALGIQLDSGTVVEASRSLALLVIAPITTGVGFVLIPAVKAARVVAARSKGTGSPVTATGKGAIAARMLSGIALFIAVIGGIGMLLGLLDWVRRGIVPTDSPYTFFAGAFAALGGVLMYLLGRTAVAPPNIA